MERIYAELVRRGIKTIYEVPVPIRAAVQAILDADQTA